MTFQIKSHKKLGRSMQFGIVARAWAELHARDIGVTTQIPFHESYQITWAEDDAGKTVGFIVWYVGETTGEAWLSLGHVDKSYRRLGVYTRLYAEFRRLAKEEGAVTILGGIPVGNLAAEAAARALGRKVSFCVWKDDL